jgi:2-polyprenyl-3-methyl-5-hydroxy-6-metoxy-1,4-benzoquinol methylase
MTRNADTEHWSRVSSEWIEWARAPNHDAFWAYRESLLAFVGRGESEALDVGCGEGRVSRELKACGYRVTALDPVRELVNAAREARSADDYAIASGDDLPFEDARFDLVMAYNVLMDVEDVSATLKEIRRVLRPAGMLVISIVHPFSDRGRFDNAEATSPLSSSTVILARRALKAWNSAMACECVSPGGRGHWRHTRLRWRRQGSQSRPFANQFRKPAMDGITCNAGPEFPCFSG